MQSSTFETIENQGSRKRISSFRVLIIAVIALLSIFGAVSLYFFFRGVPAERVRVTNLTDRSFTVSWVTESPESGAVIYNTTGSFKPSVLARFGETIAYDDRDVAQAQLDEAQKLKDDIADDASTDVVITDDVEVAALGEYYVHHVTVGNLEPETTYYFMVGSGLSFVSGDGFLSKVWSFRFR